MTSLDGRSDVAPGAAGEEYSVRVVAREGGWEVQILGGDGAALFSRPSSTVWDAQRFSSTVRQHLHWLSADRFRDYYRLPGA